MPGMMIPVTRVERGTLIRLPKLSQNRGRVQESLDDELVARLGCKEICTMTRDEVIRVICAGRLNYLTPDRVKHLWFYDRQCLDRLAHLACQACRTRLHCVQLPQADPFISLSRSWGGRH